jgi:hypothetical protein
MVFCQLMVSFAQWYLPTCLVLLPKFISLIDSVEDRIYARLGVLFGLVAWQFVRSKVAN